MVSDIDKEEPETSSLEDHGGHLGAHHKAKPQPERCLNSSKRARSFSVLNKVGKDVNQYQRHHKSNRQLLSMAFAFLSVEVVRVTS